MTEKIRKSSLGVPLIIILSVFLMPIPVFAQSKTLVIGHGAEPSHLFPVAMSQPTLDRVFNISEPLVYLDADAKPIPTLATKWEVVGGKQWRFYLRKNVVFHNGEKFTSEDVAFTIDYVKDPVNKCERRGVVKGYTYKIIDDYTIDIIQEGGGLDPIMPNDWFCINMLPKDTLTKMGTERFSREPVGTGPFEFVEWKMGEHVILKAFEKYWGGKAHIEKIVIKTIPEAATRVVALKAGDVHLITDIPPIEIKSIESDQKLQILKKASLFSMHIQLRCDIPPFKDNIELRKAVAHAIDSESICKHVLGGFGVPEGSVTPPTAFGYNSNVKPHRYDVIRAKEYLIKSGYKGEEIPFVSSNGRYFMDIEVNTAIAGYLKAIGLNVKLVLNDWPTWVDKFSHHKIEPIFLCGWADNHGDAVKNLYNIAHKNSPYHWLAGDGIQEVNKQIDIAKTVIDPKARKEAMEKTNQILHDYYYWGMCYTPIKVFGIRKGFKWTPRADETIYISNKDDFFLQ